MKAIHPNRKLGEISNHLKVFTRHTKQKFHLENLDWFGKLVKLVLKGTFLAKIGLPKNVVTGAIVRDSKVIIPNSSELIYDGDRVILIGLQSDLPAAEKLFERK